MADYSFFIRGLCLSSGVAAALQGINKVGTKKKKKASEDGSTSTSSGENLADIQYRAREDLVSMVLLPRSL